MNPARRALSLLLPVLLAVDCAAQIASVTELYETGQPVTLEIDFAGVNVIGAPRIQDFGASTALMLQCGFEVGDGCYESPQWDSVSKAFTVSVTVYVDSLIEGDETFELRLVDDGTGVWIVPLAIVKDGTPVSPSWPLVPEGLGPGDGFRLLFVTGGVSAATSSDIADYNEFVRRAANGGHPAIRDHSGGFTAAASTSAVDARDNAGLWDGGNAAYSDGSTAATKHSAGVPIYWLGQREGHVTERGSKVADSYADFCDGAWENGARGNTQTGTRKYLRGGGGYDAVWTGTRNDCTGYDGKELGQSETILGKYHGKAPLTMRNRDDSADVSHRTRWGGKRWDQRRGTYYHPPVHNPLYGLSPVFTVVTSSGLGGEASATVADDDDAMPEMSVAAGAGVIEGTAATFTLTASPVPVSDLTVSVSVSQRGDFGAATGSRTVTVPTGGTATLSIATAGDNVDEPDGSVTVTLGSGFGYTVSASRNSATVAVADDDDDAPQQCVSESLHDRVRGYHANPPSEAAKARWAAVLEAFGDDMGATAMTADEAQGYHDRGRVWREKWAGVPEAIRCLGNAAVSAVVNGSVVTLSWANSRDDFGSPSGSDYGVRVNGLARAIVSAELSGDTARLVLASPVVAEDAVTVSYLGSAMHPRADASGRMRSGPWVAIINPRPADPLAAADADAVRLDASGLGLTEVRDIGRLRALERLDLSNNALPDLSSLAGLRNLRDLDLSGNRIADLWPLAGLYHLERLNLSDNAVTDVQALAGLTNLKVLLLDGNAVEDAWPLAGLEGLENLGLAGNRVRDVTALQDLARLRRLDLSGNPAGDLSSLGDVGWVALPGEGLGASETLGRLTRLGWIWFGTAELPAAETTEDAGALR